LKEISQINIMLPEVARRLGDPSFTRYLLTNKESVLGFFQRPHDFLKETLRTLSIGEKAAIAVLFMRGGAVATPVSFFESDAEAVTALGADIPQTRASFSNLDGSFLQLLPDGDRQLWRYRHPTIRDAFADIVAEDPEQLDIYLAGAPTDTMLGEVTCGNVFLRGARVIVPESRFQNVIKRLTDLVDEGRWYRVEPFLASRCSEQFIRRYFADRPGDLDSVLNFYRWDQDKLSIIEKLAGSNAFGTQERRKFSKKVRELAVRTWDPLFMQKSVRSLIGPRTFRRMLDELATDLASYGQGWVETLVESYEGEQEPDSYLDIYKEQLKDLLKAFEDANYPAVDEVRNSVTAIQELMDDYEDTLYDRYYSSPDDDGELQAAEAVTRSSGHGEEPRDIFDDVDE